MFISFKHWSIFLHAFSFIVTTINWGRNIIILLSQIRKVNPFGEPRLFLLASSCLIFPGFVDLSGLKSSPTWITWIFLSVHLFGSQLSALSCTSWLCTTLTIPSCNLLSHLVPSLLSLLPAWLAVFAGFLNPRDLILALLESQITVHSWIFKCLQVVAHINSLLLVPKQLIVFLL